jgi:hypothetical protein
VIAERRADPLPREGLRRPCIVAPDRAVHAVEHGYLFYEFGDSNLSLT